MIWKAWPCKKYLFCESEHRPKTNCLSFKIYDRVLYQRKSDWKKKWKAGKSGLRRRGHERVAVRVGAPSFHCSFYLFIPGTMIKASKWWHRGYVFISVHQPRYDCDNHDNHDNIDNHDDITCRIDIGEGGFLFPSPPPRPLSIHAMPEKATSQQIFNPW